MELPNACIVKGSSQLIARPTLVTKLRSLMFHFVPEVLFKELFDSEVENFILIDYCSNLKYCGGLLNQVQDSINVGPVNEWNMRILIINIDVKFC